MRLNIRSEGTSFNETHNQIRRGAVENHGTVYRRQYDMVFLIGQMCLGRGNLNVIFCRDDPRLHKGRRKRVYKRILPAAQFGHRLKSVERKSPGKVFRHVRPFVRRRDHDKPAQQISFHWELRTFIQQRARDNAPHAVTHDMNFAIEGVGRDSSDEMAEIFRMMRYAAAGKCTVVENPGVITASPEPESKRIHYETPCQNPVNQHDDMPRLRGIL